MVDDINMSPELPTYQVFLFILSLFLSENLVTCVRVLLNVKMVSLHFRQRQPLWTFTFSIPFVMIKLLRCQPKKFTHFVKTITAF